MDINLYTIIFTIINFLILYLFLRKFLFGRIQDFMANRSRVIENNINDAKKNLEESVKRAEESQKKLQTAQSEGRKIVEDYKERANRLSDEIILKGKKEAERIMERARLDGEREREKAREEMRSQLISLSLLIASKAVKAQLDDKKHHEIIKDFIEEMEI